MMSFAWSRWVQESLACRQVSRRSRKSERLTGRRLLHLEQLEKRDVPAATITTVAGTHPTGSGGDGGLATRAQMYQPSAVTTDPQGDLYLIDDGNNEVREVTPNGVIDDFAGGANNLESDNNGIPATQAYFSFDDVLFDSGGGLALNSQGDLFIADPDRAMVYEVTTDGTIHIFAGGGNGVPGQGDGGPATAATLSDPYAVAVDSQGDVFICDSGTNSIREVATNGVVQTVVGNGTAGYTGDGGLATGAELNSPSDVALDGKGDLFIVDSGNNVVREVTPNGVIQTIAGNGAAGYTGNGGPAVDAELNLNNEGGVAVDGNGNLFIADSGNNVVREVNTAGIISTVVGDGKEGYSGVGVAPTKAVLDNPTGLTVSSTGVLYIADTYNNVVRKVSGVAAAVSLQVTAQIDSPTQATVGFNAFPGASNYVLSMAEGNAAPSTIAASKYTAVSSDAQPSGNVIANLQPDTFYTFRVVAALGAGKTATAYVQVETPAEQTGVPITATLLRDLAASVSTVGLPSIATLTSYASALNTYLPDYGIDTPARVSAFLSQAAEETDGFRRLSAAAGGAYRGRGFLMISGQANYTQISSALNLGTQLVTDPSLLASPSIAAQASAYYWAQDVSSGQPNTLADELSLASFEQITKDLVGSSTAQLTQREQYYQHALEMLFLGMQPGESLIAMNGVSASSLTTLLTALDASINALGDMDALSIDSSSHNFDRVVIVGGLL